jgi:Uncharacterised nucleotidyltransferase
VATSITSSRQAEALTHAQAIVARAREAGLTVRILGGVAVALRCPSARAPAPLAREFSDLDLVTDRRSAADLARVLQQEGYAAERRFNALHGHQRQLFFAGERHIDVFVDTFAMCHELRLSERLDLHPETISLADLLLTKLQIAEVNEKDVTDVAALLADHELTDDERGLKVARVAAVLSTDWGWWRTVTENLRVVATLAPHVAERVEALTKRIDAAPKTRRWRLRARLGERVPWREDPEEI